MTSTFVTRDEQPWLMDDLADALLDAGHRVDVIVADPRRGVPPGRAPSRRPGLRVLGVGPRRRRGGSAGRLLNHLLAGLGLHTRGHRAAVGPYDLAVFTSIAAFSWDLPGRLRRKGRATRLALVLWDFFPIHQYEIGRITTPGVAPLLKAVERRAIASADSVAVMTAANAAFLAHYHPGLEAEVVVVPPWSSSGTVAPQTGRWLEASVLRVVFGGQLVQGRGLHTLLDAVALLQDTHDQVDLVVAGDGPMRAELEGRAVGLRGIRLVGELPREEYRDLVRGSHLGVAITVAGVSPPTFPSKIVEYSGLGLAVLVAVEESSDAGQIVTAHGAGYATPAGDAEALARTLRTASADLSTGALRQRAERARLMWETTMSAERAAACIASLGGPRSAPGSQSARRLP